jgi:hypothetical protein
MSNKIIDLPLDEIPPTTDEKELLTWMFKSKQETTPIEETKPSPTFHLEIKTIIFIIILYILFNIPWLENKIKKCIPLFEKNYIFYIVFKAILFGIIIYYLLNRKFLQI